MNYGAYQYNPQPNIDRINSQIGELERMKAQFQQIPPNPTNLTQNFQLASNGSQNGFKKVNGIDDVKREIVLSDTLFMSNDYSNLWLKDVNGNIRTFSVIEVVPKDEKDEKIEELEIKIKELEAKLNEHE